MKRNLNVNSALIRRCGLQIETPKVLVSRENRRSYVGGGYLVLTILFRRRLVPAWGVRKAKCYFGKLVKRQENGSMA